jgi:two-component sensor histidine kinase
MALERRNKSKSDREALIKLEQVADVHDAALRTALRDRQEQTEALKEVEAILKVALERAQESQGRVQAASIIINTIYQSHDFKEVDFKRFLETLIAKVVEADSANADRITITLQAVPVNLPFNLAIPCGLIANELLVNALKHAYPDEKSGEIWIDLTIDERDNLVMKVRDQGIGMKRFPALFENGVRGLELIHVLAKDLDGRLDVETIDTTCFILHLPLHPQVARQALIA